MYSLADFNQKYSLNVPFLNFYGIISSVKHFLKNLKIENILDGLKYPYIPKSIELFLKSSKGIQDIYKVLNSNLSEPTNKEKIMGKFEISEKEMEHIYNLPFKITKNSKLQWFQYKINHFVLTTNSFLSKIKLIQNPTCTFCKLESETIVHLLWECEKVQSLLEEIDDWISNSSHATLNYNKKTFLFGILNNRYSNSQNLMILTIKYYIYTSRCLNKNISLYGAKQAIKNLYNTEQEIALKNNKFDTFWQMWNNYHILFL